MVAGFVSFTEITDPGQHRAYNEWHQLDHLPEQFPLPGIAFGQRWVSTPACRAARSASGERLDPVHYFTLYLMTEPLEATLTDFASLGRRLHDVGRFHLHRRARLSGPLAVVAAAAAPRVLVSAEAVPYRPNRGVYVVVAPAVQAVQLDPSDVLDVDGVAGVWTFGPLEVGRTPEPSRGDASAHHVTVCYLDEEPLAVVPRLEPRLARRWADGVAAPLLAGPFETILPWHWDWFEPAAEATPVSAAPPPPSDRHVRPAGGSSNPAPSRAVRRARADPPR